MNLTRKSIPHSGMIEGKTRTKLLERLLSRLMKLWYNNKIDNTLTVPSIIITTVKGKIWCKILEKNSVKKLNKCDCFKHEVIFIRQLIDLTAGVLRVYLLVLNTILDKQFAIYCNLQRLNLQGLLKI